MSRLVGTGSHTPTWGQLNEWKSGGGSLPLGRLIKKTEPFSTEDFSKYVLQSDEGDVEAENVTLGHLFGDLMEEIMDDEYDHLSCDFKTIFKKKNPFPWLEQRASRKCEW